MRGGIEGCVIALGFQEERGGAGHLPLAMLLGLVATVFLKLCEFGGLFGAAAEEAGFLKMEVAKLAFVGEEDVRVY